MNDQINTIVNNNRIYRLNPGRLSQRTVIYWMNRELRVSDNWALMYARDLAVELNTKLKVIVCLYDKSSYVNARQRDLQKSVLTDIYWKLCKLNIIFYVREGDPVKQISELIKTSKASVMITEFFPLKSVREQVAKIISLSKIPVHEVDAHNIVPARLASDKIEFAARTIRSKIMKKLSQFLVDFPRLNKIPGELLIAPHLPDSVNDFSAVSGLTRAKKTLQSFVSKKLFAYNADRNDPNLDGQSGLSPYLHSGLLSAQRVVLDLQKRIEPCDDLDKFMDEIIVRRELSDNFCFYNLDYDNFNGFPDWAKQTLNEHRKDTREYVYSPDQFEQAQTHDPLWNAAQTEMVVTGKMHGYLRMYWAKKILEWSSTPEQAQAIAIYLNDRYSLDGNDPNGYAGIAWSIGGVHDRPWGERPVFGKIRYMNYNGCQRKFDVTHYITSISSLKNNS